MKEKTTQEIIRDAPATKEMGDHWEVVYMSLAKLMENTKDNRIMRTGNSLMFYQILAPKIASGVVFSSEPPRVLGEAFIEFCKAMKAAGFEQLITSTDQSMVFKMLAEDGWDGENCTPHKNKMGKDQWDLNIMLQGEK
jgi:hypothetical protein